MTRSLRGLQLLFGAWMLVSGINYLLVPLYPMPGGSTPLAIQLMDALVNSRLLDVAMAIQLVGGALILARALVPLALCALMPVSTCAAYWAVMLEHGPLGALLALAALALNGLLMLAHLDDYRRVLQRRALALGESAEEGGSFDRIYAIPVARISLAQFIAALVPLLGAAAFSRFVLPSVFGIWGQLVLLVPAAILIAGLVRGLRRGA